MCPFCTFSVLDLKYASTIRRHIVGGNCREYLGNIFNYIEIPYAVLTLFQPSRDSLVTKWFSDLEKVPPVPVLQFKVLLQMSFVVFYLMLLYFLAIDKHILFDYSPPTWKYQVRCSNGKRKIVFEREVPVSLFAAYAKKVYCLPFSLSLSRILNVLSYHIKLDLR